LFDFGDGLSTAESMLAGSPVTIMSKTVGRMRSRRGRREGTVEMLKKIAAVLDVDPDDLT
jgi:hypothetical protein